MFSLTTSAMVPSHSSRQSSVSSTNLATQSSCLLEQIWVWKYRDFLCLVFNVVLSLSDLLWKLRSDMERSTVTRGQDLLLISPAHTVSPGLLGLTPGDLLAQPQELLRHLDILDEGEGIVTLPLQLYGIRI